MEQEITRSDLAEFIRIVRKEAGWTLQEMAAETGIPMASLSNYQTKRKFPKNVDTVVEAIQSAITRIQVERREQRVIEDEENMFAL